MALYRQLINNVTTRMQAPRLLPGRQFATIVLIVVSGVILTVSSVIAFQAADDVSQRQTLEALIDDVNEGLRVQLGVYEEILHGSAAIISIEDGSVSEEAWMAFARSLGASERYPGLSRISYSRVVHPNELESYVAERSADSKDIVLSQASALGGPYAFVERSESFSEQFPSTVGRNMFVDAARQAAAERARDSGIATLTRKTTTLVSDAECFVYLLPVYRGGKAPEAMDERRSNITGYVAVTLQSEDIFATSTVIGEGLNSVSVRITDASDADAVRRILYERQANTADMATASRLVSVSGRTWNIWMQGNPADIYSDERSRTILMTGFLLTAGVAAFLWISFRHRNAQVEIAAQQQLQRSRDELLALTSHQLRTPAAGVKQYLEMLLEGYAGKLSAAQRRTIEKADMVNNRQIEIINEILLAAELEGGAPKGHAQRFDVVHLTQRILDEQAKISKKSIHVSYSGPTSKRYVWLDKTAYKVVVENILSNAYKYTPPSGQISLGLKVRTGMVRLSISDTGVGIDPKDHDLLFQKFSRIHNAFSVTAGGNGIGLYIVDRLVHGMGGRVTVESELHKGSTFYLELPFSRDGK